VLNIKRQVLKNSDLNEQLKINGFVIINFCDSILLENVFKVITSQISEVKFLSNNNQNIDVTFHCTFLDHDKSYKQLIWELLTDLINPFLVENFIDYKILQANLFNKAPGTGVIHPHQNLTTVDEEKHTSVSIWLPLQDTNIENGTLYFLPKSQSRYEPYRNSNIHWAPMNASIKFDDYKMIPVNLKVGQALIFDDSIIHGSPNNNSDINRYVFHYLAIPIEANPIFCQKVNNIVNLIEVEDMFWQTYTPGDDEPKSPIVKTLPFKTRVYTKETLLNDMEF
jgi:hypothetical protein